MSTEPVRLSGWAALSVGLVLNGILGWALNLDPKAVVIIVVTMALTSIGGLEWARARVTPVAPPDGNEDGDVDLGLVVTVLVIVILVLLVLRLL